MPRVVPSIIVTLIDRFFPFAEQRETPQLDWQNDKKLAAILKLIDEIPPELIVLDTPDYVNFVSSIAAIQTTLDVWRTRGGTVRSLDYIPELDNLHPVVVLRDCLDLCPDESPSPSTVELTFISQSDLRENLRTDISTAYQALANGEYKATTVLAGSTVEALLFWALQQCDDTDIRAAINTLLIGGVLTSDPGSNLHRWTLHPLIRVAKQLNIIVDETAAEAKLAQNFRNLIHPGRAVRLRQSCDRGTALSALAAVEHVVRDLTP